MAGKRILVVGAGHVGLYTALKLSKKLKSREAEIVVIDPQPHMTYQPFLPEAAAGNISPRHAVVPLRRVLRKCTVITGLVTSIRHETKTVTIQPLVGPDWDTSYDHIIVAPGSVSRTLPIPGLKESAIGFKTIGEAIYLRNRVLAQLDIAASTTDPATRRRALSFTFVGGGFAGIEALAEMADMVDDALKYYPELDRSEVRWVLVEASEKILPEVGLELGAYTAVQLVERGMDVRLGTRLESCVDGKVVLSDGETFESDTICWTAGVKPHPMLDSTDLPRHDRSRKVMCNAKLQVIQADGTPIDGVWSAGDCAQVPDLSVDDPEATCAPNAQHAVRQAATLASNIVAVVRGREPREYKHKWAGSVASLGLHKGVAYLFGFKVRGLPAWWVHRTYHMSRIPSFNRKVRVVADWTLALFTKREVIALGQLQAPKHEWREDSF
ncbi:NAD(P)/FAD-dependent oxidoreductase [Longispora albida]|uniref:NAD(P)/FAD-dependent oxidoreductase n=1 Tax=Longispora albida TaxID=203523 RepID=UPI0003686FA3|nr:NAD(P)/FAD-dependent oxidoreductase [Longispora albida]